MERILDEHNQLVSTARRPLESTNYKEIIAAVEDKLALAKEQIMLKEKEIEELKLKIIDKDKLINEYCEKFIEQDAKLENSTKRKK